jgi:hypothetical protein
MRQGLAPAFPNDNVIDFPDDLPVRLNSAVAAIGTAWSAAYSSEVMVSIHDAIKEIQHLRGEVARLHVELLVTRAAAKAPALGLSQATPAGICGRARSISRIRLCRSTTPHRRQ